MTNDEPRMLPDCHLAVHAKGLRTTLVLLVVMLVTGCCGNRDGAESRVRPSYRSQDVRFRNAEARLELAGTLTLPTATGPHPAVILISGTGPQDRDETVAGHKPFLVLAEYLARRGIAVLRYDDRGVGASTGDFAAATIRDFASDGRAAVKFLQSQKEIDGRRIGLAGHSEGGIVAPMVALDIPGQVAFLVLLAAPGLPGEQIFYLQDAVEARAMGTDEATIARSRTRKQQIFTVLKGEPKLDKAADILRRVMKSMSLTVEEESQLAVQGLKLDDLINQQIRMLNSAAMRLFLVYDPVPALMRVTVPVLALTGERDLQVPPDENLPVIEAALAAGTCPDYTVRKMPGLNHLFQTSQTGLPRDYASIKETVAPAALETIADWILSTGQQRTRGAR